MRFVFIRRLLASSFFLIFLLTGCCPITQEHSDVPYRVVTQIEVTYENGSVRKQQHFFQERSIRMILEYLRYIDPYGIPREDPEAAQGRNYHIRVIYSDGSEHMYHQRADRYLRIDNGKWKRIEPEKALYLSGLLGMMPSEEPPVREPVPPLLQPHI